MIGELWKQWKVTESHLRSAFLALSFEKASPTPDLLQWETNYQEALEHNEFELALNALEEMGGEMLPRGGFWKDLMKAAQSMELHTRISYYERQYAAALDRLKISDPTQEPPE